MNERKNMQARKSLHRFAMAFASLAACILASCGVDQVAGIEGSGSPVASTPVTTTGTITGFGSVIVDGVEYATSGAQIRIDDQPTSESELRVGHVVTIKGSVNADGRTGTAREISFTSDARGAVTEVNPASTTFVLLGQTVQVTDETLFDETTQARDLSELQIGAKIRVSGFENEAGELVASRIDSAASGAGLQVRGKVQSLDTTARSFRLNALKVDYSAASVSGTLAAGGEATVRGSTLASDGSLVATQVTATAPSASTPNERGQLEGPITNFNSSTDFVVDGQRVTTNSGTQLILHGLSLGADVFVKVRGTFNTSGILVADRVEAKEPVIGFVRGVVDSVSSTGGTLTVLGISATISTSTSFEDRSNERKREFRLADLRTGDYVEVRGSLGANRTLNATLVQRDKPESRAYLQGVAADVAQPGFTVLGVAVVTTAETRFRGTGGDNKGADEFFSQAANQVVNVRGTLNGSTLVADQVRIVKK
jgi:hypothetical protein